MNRPQDRGRCAARHQAHDCKKRDPPPLPSKRVPLKPGHIPSAPDPNQPAKKTARNRQRAARRKNRRQNTRHNRQLRILQQNIAGFKSRRVELLKRLSDLKVDVAAIQEANFSVKTVNGKETHVIPEIRGWNVVAQERKTGRKTGSNSAGRGGVAWLIREGINYDILKTPPTIQNDNTTEWVGIRVYQEKNNHVVDFKDLYNLYVPPIHESSKDDNRKQNFKTTKLPVTENTLFFGDVNCHGTWDDRIAAKNQLHINMTKSVYMHFRPGKYSSCARAREFGNEKHLKIAYHTLMKVEKVKFLGVIIDEELSWEYQVDHLREKLNSCINIIKRIMKFIPKSEYHKLYDSLFKSHLSYCISSWGGISSNKLSPIFLLQKRCVRLLFGKVPMFDHASYYETCARSRTYTEHMAKKNYQLENTKPIFNSEKILSLHHLYIQHTFIELFKIMKERVPYSLYELYNVSPRISTLLICLPKFNLEITRQNFVYSSSLIWNKTIKNVLDTCIPHANNIMVPGSSTNSDLSASTSIIKHRLKSMLFQAQGRQTPGRVNEWMPENFYTFSTK